MGLHGLLLQPAPLQATQPQVDRPVPIELEARTQLSEVGDLAIVGEQHPAVVADEGQVGRAPGVEDAQTRGSEAEPGLQRRAGAIGPPVAQPGRHGTEEHAVSTVTGPLVREERDDPAYGRSRWSLFTRMRRTYIALAHEDQACVRHHHDRRVEH